MSRILLTSGPTREYLDPVRYLSNASSGRMGAALAEQAIKAGHEVVVVSGPVEVKYPEMAEVVSVVSTEEMLAACQKLFPECDGLIAVAAPCDYRPKVVEPDKIRKSDKPLCLELIETADIVATLAEGKRDSQWIVAFALETQDQHLRAMQKLERKRCNLIFVNGPDAINSKETRIEVLDKSGRSLGSFSGSKEKVAGQVLSVIEHELIHLL
jgi:phosphopantothenoylcysteine decarboxylase / phosphopantothenate---cysteine ligase